MAHKTVKVKVVIPNWNGGHDLPTAVDSLLAQTFSDFTLIIVDNNSTDNSKEVIEAYRKKDKRVQAIYRDKNYGFTGGVNPGFAKALQDNDDFVAPFNNDARADKHWLENLVEFLQKNESFGIVTCKLLHADGKTIDSTGDQYSIWGLPFPRGRNEKTSATYDGQTVVFGASGGASLYRVAMLKEIGIYDDDFFAYCEDIDISFRAQLAGWQVGYAPKSIVYHEQGGTSKRMGDFAFYQSFKNFPIVVVKNVPKGLLSKVVPRFLLVYGIFMVSAIKKGRVRAMLRGVSASLKLMPRKLRERRTIQKARKVDVAYIESILLHDLPPDQIKLRKLRSFWRKFRGNT